MAKKETEEKPIAANCCPVPEATEDQALLMDQAAELEDLFKILANDTRLRLLYTLSTVEEMCVCDLASAVGMSPQAISNQLQRLSDRGIVATRRAGNNIYYRVVDVCIIDILQKALCLLQDSDTSRDRRILSNALSKQRS